MMERRFRVLCIAGAIVAVAATDSRATMLRRMSLAQVTQAAAHVVHGTVAEVYAGRDESGLPATWITLDIARTIKGSASRRVTIKQYGVAEPLPDGAAMRVAGLPYYTVGDEVVLFLHPNSRHGFTSPVGLGQGSYRVSRTASHALVRSELTAGAPQPLDEFLSKVEQLAASVR